MADNIVTLTRSASKLSATSFTEANSQPEDSEKIKMKRAKAAAGNDKVKAVFLDADAMKDRVRQNLLKPEYKVSDLYKEEGCWQAVARSDLFDKMSLSVIAINAIWIAVDTDHNKSEVLLEADVQYQVAENLFCTFFFFEWLARFMSFKRKIEGFKDKWFAFDSVLVGTMVLEVWVMTAVVLLTTSGGGGGAGGASVVRVARLLRLTRMVRVARLLRAMPELMIMIKGMLSATRSVFFTLCLLVLIIYVFGIAFTQMCRGTQLEEDYFSSVGHSMYTLLLCGTLLDEIGDLSREIGKELDFPMNYFMSAAFFLFMLLTAFTVMNMLIGVLCEVVSAVAATEKEEMLVNYVNAQLKKVLDLVDKNKDDKISKREFMAIMENQEAVKALQEVGVDVVGLVDFTDHIFPETDDPENEAELSFQKFMEVVLQLRGNNMATVKDIVDLRKIVQTTMKQNASQLEAANLEALMQMKKEITGEIKEAIRSTDVSLAQTPGNTLHPPTGHVRTIASTQPAPKIHPLEPVMEVSSHEDRDSNGPLDSLSTTSGKSVLDFLKPEDLHQELYTLHCRIQAEIGTEFQAFQIFLAKLTESKQAMTKQFAPFGAPIMNTPSKNTYRDKPRLGSGTQGQLQKERLGSREHFGIPEERNNSVDPSIPHLTGTRDPRRLQKEQKDILKIPGSHAGELQIAIPNQEDSRNHLMNPVEELD